MSAPLDDAGQSRKAKGPDIGLRQARRVRQLSKKDRLSLDAEGLTIVLNSAEGFWKASRQLDALPLRGVSKRPSESLTRRSPPIRIPGVFKGPATDDASGSSPAGRGGAGVYIEGELGAFYLLAMFADSEPRGLPGARLTRVALQGADRGFALDDLILHGATGAGETLLEIQSKRTITFAAKDLVFKEVCGQIASTFANRKEEPAHRVAVAAQRTSHAISGPYQDVLEWARAAENGTEFFKRLNAKGVAGAAMRTFSETFRRNLVDAGVPDEDEAVWRIMRRFQILEFDFELSAPLARTHALMLARMVLAVGDASRAEALWTALIAIAIETAKSGGSLQRDELRARLVDLGFNLAGDRNFADARAKVAEHSRHALAEIGMSVAETSLPRTNVVEALNAALDGHRFVQIRGSGGVGKSALLRTVAQRVAREARRVPARPP